jgi:hypothetical protein
LDRRQEWSNKLRCYPNSVPDTIPDTSPHRATNALPHTVSDAITNPADSKPDTIPHTAADEPPNSCLHVGQVPYGSRCVCRVLRWHLLYYGKLGD